MTIRIFVLDDHELVRTGLQTLLECEEDMDVVGQAATAQHGLEQIGVLRPDVAILDVRLPDGSGIEVCREIRSLYPDIACLMLTSYADDEALFSAIMAGAAGYVLKEIGGSDLIGDIRRVSQGASLIDATLSKDIFDRLRKSQKTEARLSSLSPQERRVLDLIAQGRSNRQIAEEIFLAEKTVKNYVSSLLSKLGMQRRTEAGVYARLGTPLHVQFGQQVRHVVLDRLLGQEHVLGDLTVRLPLGDQVEDAALLVGERRPERLLFGPVAQPPQYPVGQRRVEERLPGRHPAHVVDQAVPADLLEDVARGPGHDRGEQGLVIGVGREHDARRARQPGPDVPADLDTAAVREAHVEDGDVGLQGRDPAHRLRRRAGLPHHLQVIGRLEQGAQSGADDLVVIEEEYADRHCANLATATASTRSSSAQFRPAARQLP